MRDLSRVRKPTLDVLEILMVGPACGSQIIARTGMWHPTVYDILKRLERRGWATSELEPPDVDRPPPRRRFYTLTSEARRRADEMLRRRDQSMLDFEMPEQAA